MRSKPGKPKADLTVSTTDENRIVITQKRYYKSGTNAQHYTVSLTRDEALQTAEALQKHIALLDELQRTGLA
jgi:hypothetical protein